MIITPAQMREAARLLADMAFDAVDHQLEALHQRCINYLCHVRDDS